MYARYYERRIKESVKDKFIDTPMLEFIFLAKNHARKNDRFVKNLLVTQQEYEKLLQEVQLLGKEIGFGKRISDVETLSKVLGIVVEVANGMVYDEVDKVA